MQRILYMLVLVAALDAATISSARAQGIEFESSENTFQAAIGKALKSRKLIFMDCYTEWCGPCKRLAKEVFSNDTVGAFFNKHFVCVKTDMEKGEGPTLAKQYQVNAYPTLLFIDPQTGQTAYRTVGAKSGIQWLMENAQVALAPEKNLLGMARNYQKHPQDAGIVEKYLSMLQVARLNALRDSVLNLYLDHITPANATSAETWKILGSQVTDPYSPAFEYLSAHADEFCAVVGEKAVSEKTESIYRRAVQRFIRRKRLPAEEFEQGTFNKLNGLLANYQGKNAAYYRAQMKMVDCVQRGDYNAMMDNLDRSDKDQILPSDARFYFVWLNLTYLRESKDPKAIKRGLEWIEKLQPYLVDESIKKACQNLKDEFSQKSS